MAVFQRAGHLLAQLYGNGTIDLIDVVQDRRLHTLVGDPGVTRLVFSPDGQYVATGHGGGAFSCGESLAVACAPTGKPMRTPSPRWLLPQTMRALRQAL
ncbi:MAG: hypothetical protein R3E79_46665 [Caldilineaceae bacterium]